MSNKKIGVLSLSLLTVAAIINLRNFPFCAKYGYKALFYLLLGALTFFIPSAKITAELASTFPEHGGIYLWVKKAYGKNLAFFTLWLGWLGSITWFPAVLNLTAIFAKYLLGPWLPNLVSLPYFDVVVIILLLWGITYINLYGLSFSAKFGNYSVMLGTIIPGIMIIGFGLWQISSMSITTLLDKNWLPAFNLTETAIFPGIMLSFAGAELIAFHAQDVYKADTTYPKAISISTFIILLFYILGTLAILFVIPAQDLRIADGVLQSFSNFIILLNKPGWLPLIVLALFFGNLSGLNAWIIGPAKGMLAPSQDFSNLSFFNKTNKAGVPNRLLWLQAIITSIITIFIFSSSNDNEEFIWIFTAIPFQLLAIHYIIIFLTAIKLRDKYPAIPRPYKAKYLKLMAIIGIIVCVITILFCFIPPEFIRLTWLKYDILLITIALFLIAPVRLIINKK